MECLNECCDGGWVVSDNIVGINWRNIADLYAAAPLIRRPPQDWKNAFTASSQFAFVRSSGKVIGAARAISDGLFYAAILDVGVDHAYQGRGVGRALMSNLLARLKVERVYLTSAA